MYLYHGTWAYNLQGFIDEGAKTSPRRSGRDAFCTSCELSEAAFFALRKTPANDLSQTGIILQFDSHRLYPEDYEEWDSGGTLRDEREIRVYAPQYLFLMYYYEYDNGVWVCNNIHA